ncbi:MAG: hypothetical protein FJ109_05845 [Deltaproteobacteria bacterium]|nr:hypothetical protein [Deltaproteobacteria bacterium]
MERSWTWLFVVCGLALAACGNARGADVRTNPADVTADAAGVEVAAETVATADAEEIAEAPDEVCTDEVTPSPACIAVNPTKVNFGGKEVGSVSHVALEISACGEVPLEIRDISISEDPMSSYGVDLLPLDHVPTPEWPVVVKPGGGVFVNVTYTPWQYAPLSEDGSLILDAGTLVIASNAEVTPTEVELSGAAVCMSCPTAIIKCDEGAEVEMQTVLHLHGEDSFRGCYGDVEKWQWEVEQPAESASVFLPSAEVPDPTFEVNVAGVYTFYLTAWDDHTEPSCFPATYEVVVLPDEAIWIEMTLHIPGYPDAVQPGTGWDGTPDLHLAHPLAQGPDIDGDGAIEPWFNDPYDCWWFNSSPDWGPPGTEGDPACMPGAVTFVSPESLQYRFGVHYQDEGYGPACATVRVYIFSMLVFEIADVELHDCEVWEVGTIEWPSGKVSAALDGDGTPKVLNSDLWCFHGDGWP